MTYPFHTIIRVLRIHHHVTFHKLFRRATIYIAERVFEVGGTKQLASTLIEEYLHLRHGYVDCTRELQSYLFEKLVSLGEELQGEPL